MELKCERNCHALYNLQYHLILVIKYRRPVIVEDIFQTIKTQIERVAFMQGAEVEEIAYEADHIHILISAPPQVCLAKLVNSMKFTSSRKVRRIHSATLKKFY